MALRKGWSLALLTTGFLSVGPVGILAQTSTVVCLSSFNWMTNSKDQNPCVVTAYLQGACYDGQWTVSPLPSGDYYGGPYADEQNQCQCSSITYNTISACSLCQNGTIIGWSVWDFNCSTIYPGVFLPGVPSGTAIPQWAFQDVTSSDLFNVTLARSVGDNPESTVSSVQSTGSTGPSSTSLSASLTATPDSGSISTSSGSSSLNTGAIAGGVVGGVVGVALIAGIALFFFMKRRRFPTSLPTQYTAEPSSPPTAGYSGTTQFSPQMTQPKLYDPSDPSTFPATPPISFTTMQNMHSPAASYLATNYSSHSIRPGGQYNGIPQI